MDELTDYLHIALYVLIAKVKAFTQNLSNDNLLIMISGRVIKIGLDRELNCFQQYINRTILVHTCLY
tara:strand:+ start:1042 stop:1242 length:201 start_codon:yes stop_codon:yes gene_type:complete